MDTPKLCPMCEHFHINMTGMYGDYPDPLTMRCEKGHWRMNFFGSMADARGWMLTAQKCPDYAPGVVAPEPDDNA